MRFLIFLDSFFAYYLSQLNNITNISSFYVGGNCRINDSQIMFCPIVDGLQSSQ